MAQAAHTRDSRTLGDTLKEIERHRGWDGDVEAFVKRMPSKDAAFANRHRTAPPTKTSGRVFEPRRAKGRIEPMITYPLTAAATRTFVGWGDWVAGWMLNEASGNLVPIFGSPTLTASGSPTYGLPGLFGGADTGIGFSGGAETFSGGDVYDALSTADVAFLWFAKHSAAPAVNRRLFSKVGGTADYNVTVQAASSFSFRAFDGTDAATSTVATHNINDWMVCIGAMERGAAILRTGGRNLRTGVNTLGTEVSTAAVGDIDGVGNFQFGAGVGGGGCENVTISAFYFAHGADAALGLVTNLAAALANVHGGIGTI